MIPIWPLYVSAAAVVALAATIVSLIVSEHRARVAERRR